MASLLQSRRATKVPVQRRFPMWKAPHDACGPVCVNVNGYFQFCSILSARSHTDQTCWPIPSVHFVLVLSLSDIGLPPCISVSGLLCQLFVFCRSQCEQGPIPIFLVMFLNCSCLFTQFCTKYCISVILAQWRLVPPENTVLIIILLKYVTYVPTMCFVQ